MKRKLLLLLTWVLFLPAVYGQDIITRTDGVKIEASILVISPTQIRYKLFGQPNGPTYQISPQDVLTVEQADGVRRTFAQPIAATPAKVGHNYEEDWGRNLLTLKLVHLFYPSISGTYERLSASGKTGIWVPFTLGLQNVEQRSYSESNPGNTYSTGIGLNWYPHGQGRFRFYLGPGVRFGVFRYSWYYYDPSNPYVGQYQQSSGQMFSAEAKAGVYYQITPSFLLSGDFGLGAMFMSHRQRPQYEYYRNIRAIAPININVGLRF